MYAGYGTGRACVGCDHEISAKEIEYEAVYNEGQTYHLHLGCAALWEVAGRRRAESTVEDAGTGERPRRRSNNE